LSLIEGSQSELDLIAKAKEGDRESFETLVRCHYQAVINLINRMYGDRIVAEDAAQEAFIRAWQHLPKYRPRAPFRNWVYQMGIHAAVDMLRRERPMAEIDMELLPNPASNSKPEAQTIAIEREHQVREALLSLPEACRIALVLREYEELSYKEIATMLNIPLGTVMSRLNYARKRLRELLADQMEVK
jgi:RNA polymerase sigma-70 factor (ECF subfamily)